MHIVQRGDGGGTPPFVAFSRVDLEAVAEPWWLERVRWFARSHHGASKREGGEEHFHVFLGQEKPDWLTAKELQALDWPAVLKAYGLAPPTQPPALPGPVVQEGSS